jgi:hypothetical protein
MKILFLCSVGVTHVSRQVLLDYCDAMDDSKSAMRVTNMANTFHTM